MLARYEPPGSGRESTGTNMKRAAFIALVTLAAPCLAQNPSPWAILQQSREDSNRAFDRNLMILQRQREMAQQAQAEEARAEAQRAYAEAERSRQTAAIEVTEVDKQVGALVAAGMRSSSGHCFASRAF